MFWDKHKVKQKSFTNNILLYLNPGHATKEQAVDGVRYHTTVAPLNQVV